MKDFYARFLDYLNYIKNIEITQDELDNYTIDSIYDQKYVNLVENKSEFLTFYDRILKVRAQDSDDNIRFMNMIGDWYSSLKTFSNEQRNLSDPFSADLEDLDLLLESYGIPFYYLLTPSSKPYFLLDLVNLYHIKGSPLSVAEAVKFFFQLDSEIYEYWLDYEPSGPDLFFRGVPALNNRTIPGWTNELVRPYNTLNTDPHWYYTKQNILDLYGTTKIKLPSMTPFFNIILSAGIMEVKKAYMLLSYKARLEYQQWTATGNIDDKKKWDYAPLNQSISLLEAVLAYSILFNEKNSRLLPAEPTENRMTWNPDASSVSFEKDYDDSFGIIDIEDSEHDHPDFMPMIFTGDPTRLVRYVLDDKIETKNLPTEKLQETSAISFQTSAYICGGINETGAVTNGFYRFELYNHEWEFENYLPKKLRNHIMVSTDELVFVLGGVDDSGNLNHDVYAYDLFLKVWTTLPFTFPLNILDCGYCMIEKRELLIVGGFDFDLRDFSNQVFKFNLTDGTLTALASKPGTAVSRFGCAVDQHRTTVMVAGGFNVNNTYANSYIYNIGANTWVTTPVDLQARGNNFTVHEPSGNFVNVGGLDWVSGADLSPIVTLFTHFSAPAPMLDDIQIYLQYIDMLKLYTSPVFKQTAFNISMFNWSDLAAHLSVQPIIDTSFPNVFHLNHNIFCLQPLIVKLDGLGNQIGLEVTNDVYVKQIIARDPQYALMPDTAISTPDDTSNLSQRELRDKKLTRRKEVFRLLGENIAVDETDNKTLLQAINPELYDYVIDVLDASETIYDEAVFHLLYLFDVVSRFYNINSTFRMLRLGILNRQLNQVVDFFKPIHSRYLGVGWFGLEFKDPVGERLAVDDYLRRTAISNHHEYYSIDDLMLRQAVIPIDEIIQWAYNYDDVPTNTYDEYTIYENLDILHSQEFALNDIIQWAYNYDDVPGNIYDEYTIYESMIPLLRQNIELRDKIQWAYNYDDIPENVYDEYTVYENLEITEVPVP